MAKDFLVGLTEDFLTDSSASDLATDLDDSVKMSSMWQGLDMKGLILP